MARIVVVGAGVVGLTTSMLLAKDGHEVVVLERDATPVASSPDEAWAAWERRGVNQFRLPHFFLARYREIIERDLPELVRAVEDAGGLRTNVLLEIPEQVRGPAREGDERFELLTGRRPVMELAVARAADATPGVEVRRGVTVDALRTGAATVSGVPHVVGVHTEHGDVDGDLVLDMMGRRSPLPRLLEEAGARPPDEELEDCGFMYFGRHFRSADGSVPFSLGPGLQNVGTISTLTLQADNGTWGVALVTSAKDKALLGLRDADRWDAAVRAHPMIAHWRDGEPLDDKVTTMSKIEDRIRTLVVDGQPVATGVVSVADAWACSNPMHGRGVSIGTLHGTVARDAIRDVGLDDPLAFALAFGDATDATVRPWFTWTRDQDTHRLAEVDAMLEGREYRPGDERFELEAMFGSAGGKDPELLRHVLRAALVLEQPDAALADAAIVARIRELGSAWRDEPLPGPSRDELVAIANR